VSWFRGMATMGRFRRVEWRGTKIGQKTPPRLDKRFAEPERAWHLIDAQGEVLGRLASKIVPLLCGKHKPIYQPQRDVGDYVVVVNAANFVVTGKKMEQHRYYRHSGYPGGLTTQRMKDVYRKNPVEPLRRAILGMMPKNQLKWQRMRRLRLFEGPEHTNESNFQRSPAFHAELPPDDSKARLVPMHPRPAAD